MASTGMVERDEAPTASSPTRSVSGLDWGMKPAFVKPLLGSRRCLSDIDRVPSIKRPHNPVHVQGEATRQINPG